MYECFDPVVDLPDLWISVFKLGIELLLSKSDKKFNEKILSHNYINKSNTFHLYKEWLEEQANL